jgi:hypothetical protein
MQETLNHSGVQQNIGTTTRNATRMWWTRGGTLGELNSLFEYLRARTRCPGIRSLP